MTWSYIVFSAAQRPQHCTFHVANVHSTLQETRETPRTERALHRFQAEGPINRKESQKNSPATLAPKKERKASYEVAHARKSSGANQPTARGLTTNPAIKAIRSASLLARQSPSLSPENRTRFPNFMEKSGLVFSRSMAPRSIDLLTEGAPLRQSRLATGGLAQDGRA